MARKTHPLRKLAVGAAVAGAAGYVVGVLSAPKEGKKTRRELRKAAEGSMSDVEKQLKQLHTELGDLMNKASSLSSDDLHKGTQKNMDSALKSAKHAKDKLRVVISTVRDGKASDKDLKKALQDAGRSLDHLRKFINK